MEAHHRGGLSSGVVSDQYELIAELDSGDGFLLDMIRLFQADSGAAARRRPCARDTAAPLPFITKISGPPTPSPPLPRAAKKVAIVQHALCQPAASPGCPLAGLEGVVHSLRGGSASLGLRRVAQACVDFRVALRVGGDEHALRDELGALVGAYAEATAWLSGMALLLQTQLQMQAQALAQAQLEAGGGERRGEGACVA